MGEREYNIRAACEQFLTHERISRDWSKFCVSVHDRDVGSWEPAETKLNAALTEFQKEYGHVATAQKIAGAVEHGGLFRPAHYSWAGLTATLGLASVISLLCFYGTQTHLGNLMAFGLSLIPLAIAMWVASRLGHTEKRLARFEAHAAPLRAALHTMTEAHESAMAEAQTALTNRHDLSINVTKCHALWGASQQAAQTIDQARVDLASKASRSRAPLSAMSLGEVGLALFALFAVGFVGLSITDAGLWAYAQAGSIGLTLLGLMAWRLAQDRSFAKATAGLFDFIFDNNGDQNIGAAKAMLQLNPTLAIAQALVEPHADERITIHTPNADPAATNITASRQAQPRMIPGVGASELFRQKRCAAPIDPLERRMPRDVWEA